MRETKQVIVVRTDLNMPVGKISAQVGHAAGAFMTKDRKLYNTDMVSARGLPIKRLIKEFEGEFADEVEQWIIQDYTKICLAADSEEQLVELYEKALEQGMEAHLIIDNGRTCFNNVLTKTVLAIGPHYVDKFEITSKLRLL
jgi:PTH2 family peptidyl-tRNA hydrolase